MDPSSSQSLEGLYSTVSVNVERQRKRASPACVQCRAHKVRCDVLGQRPCVRCRLEGIACTTEARRRRRTIAKTPHHTQQRHQPAQETADQTSLSASSLVPSLPIQCEIPAVTHDFPLPDIMAFEPEEIDYSLDIPPIDEEGFGCMTDPQNLAIFESPESSPDSQQNYVAKTKLSHLAPADLAYLTAKDVFKVPPKSVRDELVDKYFLYIHPLLPIVNESAFRNDYDRGLPNSSLLIYKAMLYAATSYISEKSLELCGFSSVWDAQETYFTQARLIFDFEVEPAKLARVQASLLFSFRSPCFKATGSRRNTYWLSGAITVAKELGLNREDVVSKLEPSAQKLMKRIWWACVVRDMVLAFTYRRPPLLGPDNYSIGTPQVDDLFDGDDCWIAYPGAASRIIAGNYIQLIRLAAISGKFLDEKFAPRSCLLSKVQSASSSPTPFVNLLLDVERANTELAIWKRSFLAEDFSCLDAGEEVHKGIILHRNFVFAMYNAIIIITNQPSQRLSECLLSSWSEGIQDLLESSWERTRTAAFDIISLVKELIHLGATKFLPISFSSILASATLVRSLNIHLEYPTEKPCEDTSIRVCFHTLEAMKVRFAVMQDVINIVNDIRCFLEKQHSLSLSDAPSPDSSRILWSRFRDNGKAVREVVEILRATCYMNTSMANDGVVREADLPISLSEA